jgi:hypothetical protein
MLICELMVNLKKTDIQLIFIWSILKLAKFNIIFC